MSGLSAVRARGLTKLFGDVVALDGVDLDVAPGQVHGIVGPNGAGKTTLLATLLGLAFTDSGGLEVLRAPTAGIDDVLERVGLADVADDKVRGFSLGMRQRLGLAAALLAEPRLLVLVLVLDEPSNGLDPAGKRHVHRTLARLAADGATVILSSHRMDDLEELCSEVTLLVTGRVTFSGPLDKLASENRELDYRVMTSDNDAARRVAAETDGITVVDGSEGVPNRDVLVVRALVPALDQLVPRLVAANIAVRELTPVVSPLETAFLALTERQESPASLESGR